PYDAVASTIYPVMRALLCILPTRPLLLPLLFSPLPAPPELSPLSLHDALPILSSSWSSAAPSPSPATAATITTPPRTSTPTSRKDRKSTRLNSSHVSISYAVFCLKKKKKNNKNKKMINQSCTETNNTNIHKTNK